MGKLLFVIAVLMICLTGIVGTFTKFDVSSLGAATVLVFFISIFTMMFEQG